MGPIGHQVINHDFLIEVHNSLILRNLWCYIYLQDDKLIKCREVITEKTSVAEFYEFCKINQLDIQNKKSNDSLYALLTASEVGNCPVINAIITDLGKKVLDCTDPNGYTPLYLLCHDIFSVLHSNKTYNGAKKLLELGANPNVYAGDLSTPLSRSAIGNGNLFLTALIIENGGKIVSEYKAEQCDKNEHIIDISEKMNSNLNSAQNLIKFKNQYTIFNIGKYDDQSIISSMPFELVEVISNLAWAVYEESPIEQKNIESLKFSRY